eukprot:m.21470 g.21470  ORF g.21470 m.21470 type:complete len:74 (-) comp8722_c0_seq3:131-352(-)
MHDFPHTLPSQRSHAMTDPIGIRRFNFMDFFCNNGRDKLNLKKIGENKQASMQTKHMETNKVVASEIRDGKVR